MTYNGTLISDLTALADNIVFHRPTPAQWQAAKQRPTQFGDNKNRPQVKYRPYVPAIEAESEMERDRR